MMRALGLVAIALGAVAQGSNRCPTTTPFLTPDGHCVERCPPDLFSYEAYCVSQCPADLTATFDMKCISENGCSMADFFEMPDGSCVESCPPDYLLSRPYCIPPPPKCPDGHVLDLTGQCVKEAAGCTDCQKNCTLFCPEPGVLLSTNECDWGIISEAKPVCLDNDVFMASYGICVNIFRNFTLYLEPCVSRDGLRYEIVTYNSEEYCIHKYEPVKFICPDRYVFDGNVCHLRTAAKCREDSNTTDANDGSYYSVDATPSAEPSKPPAEPSPREEPSKPPAEPSPREESSKPPAKPSSTATHTPRVRPSMTSTPTVKREDSQHFSRSPSPTPRRAIWNTEFSRPPLPSQRPIPVPSSIELTTYPTPWPLTRNLTLSEEERPPYIESRISLPSADATLIKRPAAIQSLQSSLACTLRLPLEKIFIYRIKVVKRDGSVEVLDIDYSTLLLTSNGVHGCFLTDPTNTSITTTDVDAQSRSLQEASTSAEVDYKIIDPPIEILALDTNEFETIVLTSIVLNQVAQTVGSSSVMVTPIDAEQGLATQDTPSPEDKAETGSLFGRYLGIGIGAGAFLVGVTLFIVLKHYSKKKTKTTPGSSMTRVTSIVPQESVHQVNNVLYVHGALPQEVPGRGNTARSTRILFDPEMTRRGAVNV